MPSDPSCIFCRIIADQVEASKVYHDDIVTAFMDKQPLNPGHLLVVPNEHTANLAELDETIAGRMFVVGRHLAQALRRSGLRCEGINLFLADGSAAGQTVFHSHLHVIPRFIGDGFGLRFPPGYGSGVSREDLDTIAAKVEAALKANRGESSEQEELDGSQIKSHE